MGLAASFAAGIGLSSAFGLDQRIALLVLAAGAALFAVSFSQPLGGAALLGLYLCALAVGALRLQASVQANQYERLFGNKQQLEGFIVEDVDVRQNYQFLTIQPRGFGQRILVSASLNQKFFYGDWVLLNGKVQQPENFDDFDYQKYLERYNVYAVMKYPQILTLKSHRQNVVKEWLLNVKWAFTRRVDRLLPEPQSSLLMGILIGARKTLPANIVDNFNATGTSHIIAVSGYNITIIVSNLAFLAYYLGRRWRFWVVLLVIVGFVIISGASASVARAAIMGGLAALATLWWRQYAAGPAVFAAAALMLAVNPRLLYWDASFQLSFLATVGIIYFMPVLDRLTAHWPDIFGIKTVLLTTFAAMASTLPIILFTFGRLSAVAPLANVLIIPFVPLVMLLGFLTVVPWLGAGFAFAAKILLDYILRVTAALAVVPYGNFNVKISAAMCVCLSLLILAGYGYLRRRAVRVAVDESLKI
ncbi:MAG: ComEC/Rec2 family competence protein [Patescibacteria group bacterium]|nr:ComEC/Rec2 family competence protein [Patescibacteria group bacterium]